MEGLSVDGPPVSHVRRSGQNRPPSHAATSSWRGHASTRVGLPALLLAVVIAGLYENSLTVPFVFDDRMSILENPTIRQPGSIGAVLFPPSDGSTVTSRPVLNLTLALNYAVGGLAVEGYHVVNISIHVAAALVLFGLVRRTLTLPWAPEWLRTPAGPLGFASAMLWAVHPLQTESVTYVVQRAESLGGLILLSVIYGFARATDAAEEHPRRWRWLTLVLCFVGMAAKETLVAAPPLMVLYDRTFVAGSLTEAWRRRRGFHTTAFLSWSVLAVLIATGGARGDSIGFAGGVSAWQSLLTQCDAITMYLRLAFWPQPLVFDYGTSVSDIVSDPGEVLPQAAVLLALLGATAWALARRPALGFVGAWFFLILAPSSSVVPILSQMRAEHRMYLPLVAVVVLVVAGLHRWLGRWSWGVLGVAAVALASTTVARNHDYRTALVLWADTAKKAPGNPRAHYNLAIELDRSGDRSGALASYATSVHLHPDDLMARTNLATLLMLEGRADEALPHAEAAVRIHPASSSAHNLLGRARHESGDTAGAIRAFEEAVRLEPDDAGAHRNLGVAFARRGEPARAIPHLEIAAGQHPDAGFLVFVGETYLQIGRSSEARRSFETALRQQPDLAMAHFHLGNLLAQTGAFAEAVPHYDQAVRLMPQAVPPLFNLGVALEAIGRTAEARACFERVLILDPHDSGAAEMLRQLRTDPR